MSRPRNKNYPKIWGPAVHFVLRAPQPREAKNPLFLVPDMRLCQVWQPKCKFWEPPDQAQRSPGPFGPGTPKESEKSPKGRPAPESPRVPKECATESEKSPKTQLRTSFWTPFGLRGALFGDSGAPRGGTLFGLFWGSGPRRARETSVPGRGVPNASYLRSDFEIAAIALQCPGAFECWLSLLRSDILFPSEAPLPDPTPTPPQHPETDPKQTRNRAETEPNGAKSSRNGARRSRNGPKSSFPSFDGRGVCRGWGGGGL